MSLFALIVAMLLEQLQPLALRKYLYGWLSGYADYFQHHFNSGEYSHGKIAWWLAVLPLLAGAVLVFWCLHYLHPIFAWVFNVLVLYLCMGFGQFSHYFTDIQQALRSGKLEEARDLLSRLRGGVSDGHGNFYIDELNAEEVARVTIESALVAALRHLFGVITWFVLFSLLGAGGASGALLYRLGFLMRMHWSDEPITDKLGEENFDGFASKMFYLLEWLPIRLTAATFAIVGNFEDTAYCWRSQAASWPDSETGILLASAAGASGVRLGLPILQDGVQLDRPELGVGDKTDDAALQSAVGLAWRSVALWLIMLFILTLVSLLG